MRRGAAALALSLQPLLAVADPTPGERQFSIAAKPFAEELVEFAIQANITIGGVSACKGMGHGLEGRYSLEEGLTKLLAGAPCRFSLVAARTVQLTALPEESSRLVETPAEPVKSAELAEILVTATKRSAFADRLPAAISIIGADQLNRSSDFNVSDTISAIAGMSMTNLGPGLDKILLRGLSDGTFTGRTQSTVGTYLDNLPINYNAPDPDLRLADVEAIEVVRGPQGALYGGGSLSGIYRIVTRKPDMSRYSAEVTATESLTQSAAGSRSAEAAANLPVIADQAALRLVGYSDFDGGYLTNDNLKQSHVDKTGRNGGRASFEALLPDNWRVSLAETAQQLYSADAQYTNMGASRLTRANRVSESQRSEFSQTAITISEQSDWGRLESSTGYVRHNFGSRYDASAALSLFDDNAIDDVGVYDETTRVNMVVEDLVATSADNGPFQWLVGAFASFTDEKTLSLLNSSSGRGPPLPRYREDRKDQLNELAPYGEASLHLADSWSVTGGLRYFTTELHTNSQVTSLTPTSPRYMERAADYRGWAPKLSLQHDFESGDMAYGLISEGYRAGGFNAGGLNPPLPSRTVFTPDRLTNFELGAKVKLANRGIDIRSALFCDLWSDIQTDQYLSSGLSYTANVGDARIFGWETEMTVHLLEGLSFQLNALFDTARITKVNPGFASHVTEGLPGVPDDSLGAILSYERPLDDSLAVQLTGEVSYVGTSRLTFDPAQSPSMGGYADAKLSAALKASDWKITALLTNPANITGNTFAFGNPFSFGQVRQVTPLRPRTFSFILSAAF